VSLSLKVNERIMFLTLAEKSCSCTNSLPYYLGPVFVPIYLHKDASAIVALFTNVQLDGQ
jgi:hypothetical protein